MLKNIKNDLLYLLNMVEGIEKILIYSKKFKSAEELFEFNDQINFNAILNLFGMLGENIGKVSEELKNKHNKISWREIKDFRNKIVHDYVNIDVFIVFSIIKNDLLELKLKIENIISSELKQGIFDIQEFNVSQDSMYYKHINFKKISDFKN